MDAKFEVKMLKLEKDGEELNRIKASIAAPAAKKRRKMDELFYRIYENLETDNEHIEFDLRAFRLREIYRTRAYRCAMRFD